MSSLGTALPSKQEKYLPTYMLGPLRWRMPKITNQMQNYLKYTKTSGTFFPGNVIYDLRLQVLQGSVETCVNYGRIFIDFFTANLLQSVMVKEF